MLSSGNGRLPTVSAVAEPLSAGTSPADWTVMVNSRLEGTCTAAWYRRLKVDGKPAMVMRFPACHGSDQQLASFVHDGRGYRVVWRGRLGRDKADAPLFDALLRTVSFAR
jgi:hypothetical protein